MENEALTVKSWILSNFNDEFNICWSAATLNSPGVSKGLRDLLGLCLYGKENLGGTRYKLMTHFPVPVFPHPAKHQLTFKNTYRLPTPHFSSRQQWKRGDTGWQDGISVTPDSSWDGTVSCSLNWQHHALALHVLSHRYYCPDILTSTTETRKTFVRSPLSFMYWEAPEALFNPLLYMWRSSSS